MVESSAEVNLDRQESESRMIRTVTPPVARIEAIVIPITMDHSGNEICFEPNENVYGHLSGQLLDHDTVLT